MSKRKPYARPSFIRYESEAEYPEWARSIVKTLRQELEAAQFEVKPQYVTVVDSDRNYVEVSDSFCQLVGYQREELVGMRYDDLTHTSKATWRSSVPGTERQGRRLGKQMFETTLETDRFFLRLVFHSIRSRKTSEKHETISQVTHRL